MPPVIIAAVAGAAMSVGTAWAAGTLATLTIATVATSAAISAAMAGASMLLTPKAKPFRQEMTDRLHSVRQPITPRQVIYGRVKTGGPIVFLQSTAGLTGTQPNKWLQLVIPLACHEVEAIEDVYFDADVLPLGPDGAVTGGKYFDAKWPVAVQRPRARVWKHRGEPGQVADARLVSLSGGKWTSAHVGNGIAYLYVELEYTASIYTNGIPNITAVVAGKKVYDPRDGVTRWTDNAALCIRDFMTLAPKMGGLGATESELDGPNWIAQANLCDEAVPTTSGSEKRYTVNGTVSLSASNSPRNTLEGLLTSCAGSVLYAGGQWRLLAAAYRNPANDPITYDELRGDVGFMPRPSTKDTFNAVKGTYSSPENLWQAADYPPVVSATFAAEDGETKYREVDLPYTTSSATAQRLGKIQLLRSRQPITVNLPCKLWAMRFQAGDVVPVTLPRQGWNNKPFELIEWGFAVDGEGGLGVDLALRETHPSIYDYATSEEQATDPAPGTDLPDWRAVPDVRFLSADSSNSQVVVGTDGTLISRVLVTWSAALSGVIERYEIQWRLSNDTNWPWAGQVDGNTGSDTFAFYIDNLPVGTVIDIRVRALNSLGVPGNFVTLTAHTIAGYSAKPNPPITGLKVVGSPAGNPGQFLTADAVFEWAGGDTLGALFQDYVVTIRDATTNAVRRAVPVTSPRYTYLFADNATDGLNRTFKIGVQVRTRLGGLSTEVQLTAANPVPALPTAVSITGDFRTVTMRYVPPTDPDYAGVLVWRSATSGFTPSGTAPGTGNCVYAGPDTLVVVPAEPGTTYYLRYAAYDGFGRTGLTQSGEIAATTVRISHADLAQEIIDTSNLIPSLNTEITKIAVLGTRISTEETTRASETESLSQRIDNVQAITGLQSYRQATAPTGTIPTGSLWFDTDDNNKAYRWSGTAWVVTDDTRIATNTAAIQTEVTARTNAVSAEATARQTLQTQVNGNTSSIETAATSINGLESQYTVKVQTNGYVSGYGLASTVRDGTPTSSFVVSADRFAVAKPGTGGLAPTIPFIIVTKGSTPVLSFDGYASFSKILSGTIDTELLYIGGANTILDGPNRNIRINDGTRDLVRLGQLSTGVYGIEIKDSSGNLIMSSAAGLAAGTVGSAQLATGLGGNQLYNSNFSVSTDGWIASTTNSTGAVIQLSRNQSVDTTLFGGVSLSWFVNATPANGAVFDIANVGSDGRYYPVIGGARYEASGYMGAIRNAGVDIYIAFFNGAGSVVGEVHGNRVTNATGLTTLSGYGRSLVLTTAPATAVRAYVGCRVYCNGGASPFGVVTQAYFGAALANQTQATPWSAGPGPVTAAGVTGLGALAAADTLSYTSLTGKPTLGTLAGLNKVDWGSDINNTPAFGPFSTLSQITQANASTYIAAAALGSAHIGTLTADKLAAGIMRTDAYIAAGNTAPGGVVAVVDGRNGGSIYINDPRTSPAKTRVFMGLMPGVDYGFWLWDANGAEIFGTSGLTGTWIKDATIGTLKIGANQITVPVTASLASSVVGTGSYVSLMGLNVTLGQGGTVLVSVSLGHTYPTAVTSFNMELWIGGTLVTSRSAGTGSYVETPAMIGSRTVAAGTHYCEVRWRGGNGNVTCNAGTMFALGAMR